jgi:H+-transporting ATPase
MAVVGTQALATLIAVYGLFMTPLGWAWAACVWGYALAWALVNDRVKLAAYWVLDRTEKGSATKRQQEAKADGQTETKPAAATEDKPGAEAEVKPDTTAEANPHAKAEAAAPAEAKPDTKAAAKPATAADAKPNADTDAKPDASANAEAKPATAAEAKPGPKSAAEGRATPQLVARVHELYEELGREDVRAVQDWDEKEKAAREGREDGPR